MTTATTTIGANEDMFLQAFDDTPVLAITTPKKLEGELFRTIAVISNPGAEWDERVKALKHFRSLMNSELATSDDYIVNTLKTLELPFQNNIRDLRSQVVRETCITIAFLSCRLQQKFSRMAEVLLVHLIKLIPNSAKIMSSSAIVALRFIIQSTQSSRLLPIIKYQLSTSKSKEIRRACCEIAERIVTLWSPLIIERGIVDLQEIIRLGICDSDEQARQYARRSFNIFSEHFKQQAEKLYKSLDLQKQRMLSLNRGSGSTLSVNGTSSSSTTTLCASSAVASGGQSGLPTYQHHLTTNNSSNHHQATSSSNSSTMLSRLKNTIPVQANRSPTARSTSAIDVAAQRRAKARALYLSPAYRTRPFHASPASTTNSGDQHQFAQPHAYQRIAQARQAPSYAQSSAAQSQSQTRPQAQPQSQLPNLSSLSISDRLKLSPQHLHNVPCLQPQVIEVHMTKTGESQSNHQQQQNSNNNNQQVSSKSALSKAAAYLESLLNNSQPSVQESQIVTAIKYFHSIIDKSHEENVGLCVGEIMPPLILLAGHESVYVRKVSTCALVSVHSKIGIKPMEPFLNELPVTPRKMLDLYIKRTQGTNTSIGGEELV